MRKKFTSFRADDKLDYILKVFAKKKIGSAPVLDGNEFVGMVCVHRMVKYFTAKEFAGMWSHNAEVDLDGLKKIIANDLAKEKKPGVILHPEELVGSVLKKISKEQDCVPVIDKKGKLVGIIRQEDLVNLFLKQCILSKECPVAKEGKKNAKASKKEMNTELDRLLEIVNEEEEISAGVVAKRMGISKKKIEEMAECLDRHHLIQLKYSFIRGAILRSVDHEQSQS